VVYIIFTPAATLQLSTIRLRLNSKYKYVNTNYLGQNYNFNILNCVTQSLNTFDES